MAAIIGAIDAGIDLLLKNAATALALHLYLGLPLLRLMKEVDAGLGQGIHG
jgi:hypothetical protein